MKRVRVTFEGAYHHVMNRGIKKENIFHDDRCKSKFLNELQINSKKFSIVIYAYCIMNNHYHIILQDTNGNLSEFMKYLNSEYGRYYRKRFGGRGYVFESRFKSCLIENDSYLVTSIIYTLLNPVRAKIVAAPYDYEWSSINYYFSNNKFKLLDSGFVEELLSSNENMRSKLFSSLNNKIDVKTARDGNYIGSEVFMTEAINKYERRRKMKQHPNMRKYESKYMDINYFLSSFERENNVKLPIRDFIRNSENIKIRNTLLIFLRDVCNLTYKDINQITYFKSLKYTSLSSIYKKAKDSSK